MKLSLSWLYEHLDSTASFDAIVDTLTRIGLEVEAIDDPAARLDGFIVGEIIDAAPHPNADRLRLCRVNIGTREVQLVCGASNARTGLKGVFAPIGALIPSTQKTLTKAKIRGSESEGMLCSEQELQISDDHDAIIELPATSETGTQAAIALGLDEKIIDIGLTPNRPDCLGVRGIARDLASAGIGTLKPDCTPKITPQAESPITITVEGDSCPAFGGCLIRNVKNTESPAWLQKRLFDIGIRSINALVDITNYISYDRARPLHVYDFDAIKGNMMARQARTGESFTALDDKNYELTPDDCVICDETGVLGLAGIMGGASSACQNETQNVFIESAWFDPIAIAKSGRQHRIESDARQRFERGVDRASIMPGLELAVAMILDICGGETCAPIIGGTLDAPSKIIEFDPENVKNLTGLTIPPTTMQQNLTALGFAITGDKKDTLWQVNVPTWRPDIDGQADLVEEIIRLYGLDEVPSIALPSRIDTPAAPNHQQVCAHFARRVLANRGMVEAVNWSFIDAHDAALFSTDNLLQLANPISSAMSHMRPSLLGGILAAIARNAARGQKGIHMFEVGHQFAASTETNTSATQRLVASGIRWGVSPPRHWHDSIQPSDIWAVRADAEAVLAACGVMASSLRIQSPQNDCYHPGQAGILCRDPRVPLAAFGAVHPKIATHFDLPTPLMAFEVYLDTIPPPKAGAPLRPPLQMSNFQAVRRDFAFIVDADTPAATLINAAQKVDKNLISNITLFDIFSGEGVPKTMKSLAIEVTLQPHDATLTDAEIDAVADKIIAAVEKATGGTLRR